MTKRLIVSASITQRELDTAMNYYQWRTKTTPDRIDYIQNNKIKHTIYLTKDK